MRYNPIVFQVGEEDYVRNFRLVPLGKAPAGKEAANVIVSHSNGGPLKGRIVNVARQLSLKTGKADVRVEVTDPGEALIIGGEASVAVNVSPPVKLTYAPTPFRCPASESALLSDSFGVHVVNREGRIEFRKVAEVPGFPDLALKDYKFNDEYARVSAVTALKDDDRVVVPCLEQEHRRPGLLVIPHERKVTPAR